MLLDLGCARAVNAVDAGGRAALMEANDTGDTESAALLRAAGAGRAGGGGAKAKGASQR